MNMNKRVSFSIWYVFLAIWAVILVHDFIPLNQDRRVPLQPVQNAGDGE